MSKILYSADHLWFLSEKNTVKVGISDHLKSKISPVFMQLPEVGTILNAETPAGSMESKKFSCEFVVPFSCVITERNEKILESPALVAQQPESLNWLYIVSINDEKWSNDLMDAEDYKAFIEP